MEIRDAEQATEWLSAGLCLTRLAQATPDEIPRISRWAFKILSESGTLPPLGTVADIAHIALGRPLDFRDSLPGCDPELQAAIRTYEDQFLGRLAADPRLEAVSHAISRLSPQLQADAIPLLVARIIERIRFSERVSMSPGVARRATESVSSELLETGFAVLRRSGAVSDALIDGYEGLVNAARRTGSLLSEGDVFLLENLAALDSLSQRLAIEQMVEVAGELTRAMPRRMKPRDNAKRGHTPTNIEDEDRYPTGGFSSISTVGTLENLVSSELIYMEEGLEPNAVDLFDMRYVEGELLYYTRDESVFVRTRRAITFALMPDLSRARFKDQGVKWQRLVIVFGLISCAVQRLADWLSESGLQFRVVFVHNNTRSTPLKAEKALCELLLGEWIEKEMCVVEETEDIEDVLFQATEAARTAQSDVVIVTMDDLDLGELDSRIRVATLNVKEPIPSLTWNDKPVRPGRVVEEDPWTSWVASTLELLQGIV